VRANGIDFQVSRFRSGPEGERPIVVCVHGLGVVDGASMSMTVGMPLAKFFDVIMYDLRGHGRTQFVTSGYTVADHVSDLLALLDELAIEGPVHLLTGSYGGTIGIMMALDHTDRVKSLSMVDPMFLLPEWGENLAKTLGIFADRIAGASSPEAVVQEVMDFYQTTARRRATALADRGRKLLFETTLLDDLRSERALSIEQYAQIRIPVFGSYGLDSDIYVLSMLLKDLIPHSEIVEVPGANHITVFSRPETRNGIASFIQRVEAERALRELPASANGLADHA
jgi:pimeloyl-ACP methyl ester carboxylesterase